MLMLNILLGLSVIFMVFMCFKVLIEINKNRRQTDHARLLIDMFEVGVGQHEFGEWPDNLDALMNPNHPNQHHFEIVDNKGVDVHDHTVQESLTTSFNALKYWYDTCIADKETATDINSLKSAIFKSESLDKIEKAYSTVRSIEKHNCKISSIDTDELTVLNMVWKRINEPVNASVKNELIDSLICQLADASIDLDLSRCASGRVTRIIQSLEAIDAEHIINLTSTEAIQRELADKVPLLIEQFMDNDNIVSLVDEELRKDYVDTKLLTEQVYCKIVKDYLDAVKDYKN